MRCINDRINCPERIDHRDPLSGSISCEFGNEQTACPVLFGRKRPFSQIEWQVFEEPTVVIEVLRFAMTKGIDCDSESWGPVIRQCVVNTIAGCQPWTSIQLFLLPSKAEETSDVLVEAPSVLSIGCVIVRESREVCITKLTSNDLETNR